MRLKAYPAKSKSGFDQGKHAQNSGAETVGLSIGKPSAIHGPPIFAIGNSVGCWPYLIRSIYLPNCCASGTDDAKR